MSVLGVFNLGAKKNASSVRTEEGVHYKIVKDGNNLDHKVLNFENEDLCPRNGIVELEPLKKSRRHLNNISFRTIRDKEFDVIVGIPLGIDPKTKSLMYEKIILNENESFDLSDPKQAMKWACIKRSHFFIDSPNYQPGCRSPYKAVDKEREAIQFEKDRRTKRKAVDIAEELVGLDLEDVALSLGIDPKLMSPKTLWMEVVKFAEKESKKFMEVYESETRWELSVLKRGLSMGVLSDTVDKGIAYNGLTLGFNEAEAIRYLRDHKSTATSIDNLSRKTEDDGLKSMGRAEKPIVDEKDAEIARLKRELAQREAQAKEATEKALELQSTVDLENSDPELAELVAEAKRLGVKGVHNMRDKAKIRAKIEEKIKALGN